MANYTSFIFVLLMLIILSLLNLRSLSFSKWLSNVNRRLACNQTSCDCTNFIGPYIAPGPSQINKLVPMEVLKETLQKHSSVKGLRLLDHLSLSRYSQCKPKSSSKSKDKINWCRERVFKQSNGPLVALASFHGSGNTWLRYLLEQATGIYTGSIYCDEYLKATFPGEFMVSRAVVAIKTHRADSRELPKDVQLELKKDSYDKAIILVRNPFDALLSEANRRWNSKKYLNDHVGLANENKFIGKIVCSNTV